MTTTLRPSEPLQLAADGTRSRRYTVCVNSRPVGGIHLATDPATGGSAAWITDLRIDEPDRRRGRGTVAALAAEEIARGWGCRTIEASVPDSAAEVLRMATGLGYVLRNRLMEKPLPATAPALPAKSTVRPLAGQEFTAWQERSVEQYVQEWATRGVPEAAAREKALTDQAVLLPEGPDTPGVTLSVLEHDGDRVGVLWLGERDGRAFVYDVETEERYRGRGHGRTLMHLAEAQAIAAGGTAIRLNVFAGNAPAENLYASLGYTTLVHHVYKPLL